MRIEATATTMSWIPSESVWSGVRLGFELGITHFDDPLPDAVNDPEEVYARCARDKFRFANVLSVWAAPRDHPSCSGPRRRCGRRWP